MFEIKGKIEFDPIDLTKKHIKQSSWKKNVIVKFNCDIHSYYSWFLKKRFNLTLNKPLRGTHVTLVSDIVDNDIYNQSRNMFDGMEISITYDPTNIRSNDKGHWWIKVYSDDIDNIRRSMCLSDPYFGTHLTIGIATHLQLEHSKYITRIDVSDTKDLLVKI